LNKTPFLLKILRNLFMSDIKIIGVGSPMLDLLVNVDDSFIDSIDGEKGGMNLVSPETLDSILAKTESSSLTKAPGGSAANTIFGLANLGVSTALLGKTGADSEADFYRQQYRSMNGDTLHLKVNEDVPTGRCLSLVTPDSERTMRTDLGAAATLSVEDVTAADFADFSHVHIEGYMLFNADLTSHILKLAKNANCIISLDLASFEVVNAAKELLKSMLTDYVDIVFANEEEAAAFCGTEDPEKCLDILAEYCTIAAVKVGKDGAFIKRGNEKVKVNAGPAVAIDTTGAGDLWASGFLYGILNEISLEEAGKLGSLCGDEVVQVMGAAIPEEGWKRIKKFLNA
jgi:sugar/nucleoside kinase (ribokinase family)